jgi:XTP/dITP diphosphohydrolase
VTELDKEIWFSSNSEEKLDELNKILECSVAKNKLKFHYHKIQTREIQTDNMDDLIRHKALETFKKIKRPVLVEHTSLILKGWGDLPGGLTQIIWDRLGEDDFIKLVKKKRKAVARTYLGYIDGRKLYTYIGEVKGKLAEAPIGDNGFKWDRVFIPKGHDRTFAQMNKEEKNRISMRKKAIDAFLQALIEKGEI